MIALVAVLVLSAPVVFAADLSSVDALYWRRDQGRNLDTHIEALEAMLKASPFDAELTWRWGRAVVRRAERRTHKDTRLADFLRAEDALKRAVVLNPNSVDAHFYYGVAMGRRGEAQGVMKSVFLLKPIKKEMHEVLRLDPKYGGAHRVLGEIFWQVPGLAGGDKRKALSEFEAAVVFSPHTTTNYLPLAEAYLKFDMKEKALATLHRVLAEKNPEDPAAAPRDLADAQKLLDSILH